jgi:arginine-tRNA-protein transferase
VEKRGNPDEHREYKGEGVVPEYLGGYHMIHRLDGKVFAVGVIDLTHIGLSSVYLYYDPDYEFLSPGVFSAVREIEYVKMIQKSQKFEALKYYYMGYYF